MKTREEVLIKLGNQTKKVSVELASLQSVIKLDDMAFKAKDKSKALIKKAKDSKIDAINSINSSISIYEKVISEVTELQKQVKDLGVSLPNEARVALDSANREVGQLRELKNSI